jgi:hypothetical protein
MYDYHPKSIPAHTIIVIDSDEVLYYVDGDFMVVISSKDILPIQKEFPWTSAWSNGKKHRS